VDASALCAPGERWTPLLSTEDGTFASDAQPADVDGTWTARVVFKRPGAMVFAGSGTSDPYDDE
jgi:hypothetical protein